MINNKNSIEKLLTYKGLEPLEDGAITELKYIQELDVTGFSEADVREEIINPILKILGYRKGQYFSVDREKHLSFLGKKSKYIDYNLTLWKENFWIIEAKKPLIGDSFNYNELRQAVEYSIHPKINASIIVLCDGIKIEVFDREENLEEPILSFKISTLLDNFNKFRNLVSPIQIWFFYKRRVLKSVDKAFENEFNQQRVNEFQDLINTKLLQKRAKILKNFQSIDFKHNDHLEQMSKASIDEIIDIHFFSTHSIPAMNKMNEVLINDCKKRGDFHVIYKLFPYEYRDINESYIANGLYFLIYLKKEIKSLNWSPSWLNGGQGKDISIIIKKLIHLSLNYFKDDEPRKIILLSSLTYRRIFKILSIITPEQKKVASFQHLIERYSSSEFSWSQILSSENRNLLINLDIQTIISVTQFVKKFKNNKDQFKINLAKQALNELWRFEEQLLQVNINYNDLLKEKDLGEIHPTEYCGITYDSLGHLTLCLIKDEEEWKEYVLKNHLEELKQLRLMGSWSAKEILEKSNTKTDDFKDVNLSDRFFFGDDLLYKSLKKLYNQ